jgi:hypothetical protein
MIWPDIGSGPCAKRRDEENEAKCHAERPVTACAQDSSQWELAYHTHLACQVL